ncbi:zinc-dependent alcohol dehydrogenase [Nocardioides sp.]|uniref:zinc-dependent alcohol dehydrogenase n=1 Tax=Nocardioides sp. TaxID=35761 RepID=UPI002D7FA37A|nr:zinc-binding dehydrogenase [Nocardioides sp.]HET8960868.1 zinc-binding dehydrogenase [Nocardioides sp.]
MKVARLHGVGDLRVRDEQPPHQAAGRSLVRVQAIGLCGSDLHWFSEGSIGDASMQRPLVLGHEFSGRVEGGELDGRLVAVDPSIPCRRCPTCAAGLRHLCPDVVFAGHGEQDGGLQELVSWPTSLLHPLPESMNAEEGALLEPLGVALHALDLGHVRAGDRAAVVGCGPIGLLLLQLLLASGSASVLAVDPLPHRRALARDLGAQVVLAPEELLEAGAPWSGQDAAVDVSFEVAGTDQAVHVALQAVRPGGRVVLVGIPEGDQTSFQASLARRKGLSILMSRRMGEVYPRAIRLAQGGAVDLGQIVSHRFGLAEAAAALETAVSRRGHKVLVIA